MHPTAYLHIIVRETQANDELFAALTRSYAYISPLSCSTGEANEIRLRAKLGCHSLWGPCTAEQDAVWTETLHPWLECKLRKVQNTVEAYNNEKARSFCGVLPIELLTLELDSCQATFEVRDNRFPHVVDLLDEVRITMTAAGILNSVERIFIPWPNSTKTNEPGALTNSEPAPWECTLANGETHWYNHAAKAWL